jgi:hypothetical protein
MVHNLGRVEFRIHPLAFLSVRQQQESFRFHLATGAAARADAISLHGEYRSSGIASIRPDYKSLRVARI